MRSEYRVPSQISHLKKPLVKAIAQRVSPSRNGHLYGILTVQATAWGCVTEAICAVPAPRRLRAAFFAYFLLLVTKSRSPKA